MKAIVELEFLCSEYELLQNLERMKNMNSSITILSVSLDLKSDKEPISDPVGRDFLKKGLQ